MSAPKYIIGCGFHTNPGDGKDAFFRDLWLPNTYKYSQPDKVIVIADSGCIPPPNPGHPFQWLNLDGDLGQCGELLNGTKPHRFPTGPSVVVALAMLAYIDDADLVVKENDLLWFGDCVGEMYRQIGDGGIIMGRQKCIDCANSMLLIRHWFLPQFVSLYMASPAEHTPDMIAEAKFKRFADADSENWRYYDLRFDRDRPLDMALPVWYAQKFTTQELTQLKQIGLI